MLRKSNSRCRTMRFRSVALALVAVSVERLMHLAELLVGEVRIDLRGGDRRVPEECLHAPQIRSVDEQIRGK